MSELRRHREESSVYGRHSAAAGQQAQRHQRRGSSLDFWEMSGRPPARLPGRLLPSQHQPIGVRDDGLHRVETCARGQGGTSEVSHPAAGGRAGELLHEDVPNQERPSCVGERRKHAFALHSEKGCTQMSKQTQSDGVIIK